MPTEMAISVIDSVTFMPSHRIGRAPGIEVQSNSYMIYFPLPM